MRLLRNTLYVTQPEAYLSKEGQNIIVSVAGKEVFRIPAQNVESVCTFGYHGASPGVMKLCVDNNISLSFFTPNGRFISRIQGPVSGNVLVRCQQHVSFSDSVETVHLSSLMVAAKIYNSRVVLRRFMRDYPEHPFASFVETSADKLKRLCKLSRNADTVDTLRGIEGQAASLYFGAFQHLILNKEECFKFDVRNKRPPKDIVNAMLSFGYTMLANDCASALEMVGLDPAIGFMHTLRPGRKSLALDLMEELRAYMVDRLVISLINTRQISKSDFKTHGEDSNLSVIFTDKGLKTFLAAWQNKKKSEINHPFLNEKVPVGLLPYVQAQLLSRYLRHDLDDYPVFVAK